MRFAAFVVVVVFSEVHSQQQCSDSLGTCSGSRASLMQVKSLSQKLQASTGRGTSNRAQTLAGFQKYTQELVDTYLQKPAVTDGGGLIDGSSEPDKANEVQHNAVSPEVIEAIGIISEYLDQLYIDLQLFHEQDKKSAEFCANVPTRCLAANFNTSVEQAINNVLSHVEDLKTKHQTCRQELAEECADAVCPDYHKYRKYDPKALLPGCAKLGHLSGQDAQLGSDDLMDFELCLVPTKEWLDPLYGKYIECKNQAVDEQGRADTCKSEQGAFEDASCHSTTWITIHCDNHAKCLDHGKIQCELGSTSGTADCAQIEQNWKARQSDNVTAERIRCLLKVLVSMDGDKGEQLLRCHDATYEKMKAFWVIDCAVDVTKSPQKCQAPTPALQCSDAWMSEEYCTSSQCLTLRPAGREEDNCYQSGLDACSQCGVDQSLDFEHAHVKTGFS